MITINVETILKRRGKAIKTSNVNIPFSNETSYKIYREFRLQLTKAMFNSEIEINYTYTQI